MQQAGRPGPRPPLPDDLEWTRAEIEVDERVGDFDICNVEEGIWVAVGQIGDTIVSLNSRKVPLDTVRLEALNDHHYPPPPAPDLGEQTSSIIGSLDDRFDRVPFRKVHRHADYWALRSVETDHVRKLAHQHALASDDANALRDYWLERVSCQLGDTLDRLADLNWNRSGQSKVARHLGSGTTYHLWFNTLGPGARTWFGNRYTTIRHYTFRVRWRP